MAMSTTAWMPEGFVAYKDHYPNTAWQCVPAEYDKTGEFIDRWLSLEPCRMDGISTVVLTPGLFSEFLPRCFAPAARALDAAGFRVMRTRVRSRYGVRNQASRLAAELMARLEPGERFIWCGHSKGAIDLLFALETTPSLRDVCAAAVVVQPAVGISRVVDRWQNDPRGVRERAGSALIGRWPVRDGVREISGARDPVIADWLEEFTPAVPTVCAVSWSIQPTSWVDSYHRTLNEIAPGHAHDGQFLLVDQRLPGASLVCLPQLDHAQPVLGGHSFEAGRFWRALVEVALPWIGATK
jgi:alpha-beta hydrolase superfamily lysophospholipase